ncbi:ATP synthase F1 subunit gamma [Lujinxingia sediminis]|uniref:ATP synthase gamma chain n=1 Tax=Lujinxingia sediminis TaxID=2480984 RepID=A0ABY0CUX0_9DELT|nr:ATP synthase F1 subunit gamma [Lujinxingia sediminis]RVU46708.1 ATP synthase F1 subunit gamma [Lujinxingia sediminis]
MPNLKDIRKRIGSVKNTQKITRAMKMVAAAKLRRAQERMEASRPYAVKMGEVIDSLASRVDPESHPLLARRELREKALVIVVSSNRGLCGGFNTNLFRRVDRFLKELVTAGEKVDVVTVGRKAASHFGRSGYPVMRSYDDVIGAIDYAQAKRIAQEAMNEYLQGDYEAVYICYNRFVSAIAVEQTVHPLLPFATNDEQAEEVQASADYIYEPDVDTLLGRLLPGHIEVQVLQALLESEASEQASRMTAMDNATNNATDMIASLTLQYNRARQAYITKEIVEIVSGSESLNS